MQFRGDVYMWKVESPTVFVREIDGVLLHEYRGKRESQSQCKTKTEVGAVSRMLVSPVPFHVLACRSKVPSFLPSSKFLERVACYPWHDRTRGTTAMEGMSYCCSSLYLCGETKTLFVLSVCGGTSTATVDAQVFVCCAFAEGIRLWLGARRQLAVVVHEQNNQ